MATSFSPPRKMPQYYLLPVAFHTPIGSAKQLPLQRFLDHVLPPLCHGTDPAQVVQLLRTSPRRFTSARPITQKGRWRGFTVNPADSTHLEEDAFRWLTAAVDAIIRASNSIEAGNAAEPRLQFHYNEECVTTSTARSSRTLPDSFMSMGDTSTWSTIGVCGEYKKSADHPDIEDVSILCVPSLSATLNRHHRTMQKLPKAWRDACEKTQDAGLCTASQLRTSTCGCGTAIAPSYSCPSRSILSWCVPQMLQLRHVSHLPASGA